MCYRFCRPLRYQDQTWHDSQGSPRAYYGYISGSIGCSFGKNWPFFLVIFGPCGYHNSPKNGFFKPIKISPSFEDSQALRFWKSINKQLTCGKLKNLKFSYFQPKYRISREFCYLTLIFSPKKGNFISLIASPDIWGLTGVEILKIHP